MNQIKQPTMKKLFFLLLLGLFAFPASELVAQTQTQTQALTKKQLRQMKRDQRKHTREAMDQAAHEAALLEKKENIGVRMPHPLYGPKGQPTPVSDNTNFIQFKDNTVYVQLAFNGIAGPNGLGGITVQGTPNNISSKTDKYGNVTYSFYVNGTAITAQVIINLNGSGNYAQATVYPMMNNNNLTFSGTLVPTSQSGIFRSGFISY